MYRATYAFGLGGSKDICLLGAHGAEYGFYVAFRLTLRHVIPAAFVIATLARPGRTPDPFPPLLRHVDNLYFAQQWTELRA